jgi:hypothetical protein
VKETLEVSGEYGQSALLVQEHRIAPKAGAIASRTSPEISGSLPAQQGAVDSEAPDLASVAIPRQQQNILISATFIRRKDLRRICAYDK